MAKCKSCGATINFVSTNTGKYMPVEPGVKKLLVDGDIVEGWEPHWANCPGADKHRKRKPVARSRRSSRRVADPTDGVSF